MDTITHSLLGALVVRSAFPASGSKRPLTNRQRLLTGAIAGAFPDVDYVASFVDPMVYLTLWHRSITHSFVMLPLWALLVGVLLSFAFRQRGQWCFLTLLAGISVISHILSDLITVYGTQIFSPLSGWRASIGTTFIIDPWFTMIVLIGFIAGLKENVRLLPQISLAILVAYVTFQGVLKYQALSVAYAHVNNEAMKPDLVEAFPQPFSPYNWKLLIKAGDRYDTAYINLNNGYTVVDSDTGFWADVKKTYRASHDLSWKRYHKFGDNPHRAKRIRALWKNPKLDYFRKFAAFPMLYRMDTTADNTCVWFTDLRYVLPYMTPPFRYGLCQSAGKSDWRLNRLRRFVRKVPWFHRDPATEVP